MEGKTTKCHLKQHWHMLWLVLGLATFYFNLKYYNYDYRKD